MLLTDLLNTPTEIEFEGKVYKLRQPTITETSLYARWLEQRAREAAGRAVDIPDADRRQLLRDITADIAAGQYEWEGPVCWDAMFTPFGMTKFMSILLADQGITPETAKKLVEQHLLQILAVMADENADPKVVAAVLARAGLPPDWLSNLRTRRSTTPSTTSAGSATGNSSDSTATSDTPAPPG